MANVIDFTKAPDPSPPTELGDLAKAEVTVSSSGGVDVAPLLNVIASGICVLLTVWQAANYAHRCHSYKKSKKQVSSFKKEILEIAEKIGALVRDKEELLFQQGQYETDKNLHELNNSITYLRLDKDANEEAISQLSGQQTKEIKELGAMLEDLGLSAALSSTYFSSSAMAGWAPATLSFGIAGNVVGGVVYGSLLAWAAARGLKSDIQILKALNDEIASLEKAYEALQEHRNLPFFEAKKTYFFLKINNFKSYRRLVRCLAVARNACVVGLGTSSAVAGGVGSAIVLGAESAAVTGLAVTGYGVITFLAGALLFGVVGLSKKHHLVGRKGNFFRRCIGKKTGNSGKQLYANYMDLNRKIRDLSKEHNKLLKKMDLLGKQINSELHYNIQKTEIEPLYDQLLQTADKVVQVLEKMEFQKEERAEYQLFVEATGKKSRKAAESLMATIDGLKSHRTKDFAKAFGLYDKTFCSIESLELKKHYLKAALADDVVTPHENLSGSNTSPLIPLIPPVLFGGYT